MRKELAVILAIGVVTPLVDSRVEVFLVQYFATIRGVVNLFDFGGGPLDSSLLVAWEQYGAVLAAFLVRKPGSGTIAMGVNGFVQIVVDGFQGPHHAFYWLGGIGADLVFAAFRHKRYDAAVSALAGIAAQFFWLPATYAYHAFPL